MPKNKINLLSNEYLSSVKEDEVIKKSKISLYKRPIYSPIMDRILGPRKFVQVLSGPRQVGKTTLAYQVRQALTFPCHYAAADEPNHKNLTWIEQQWEIGRFRATQESSNGEALLILDEIQKIPHWSEVVKKLWDQDSIKGINLKVLILGSSTLLIDSGLSDSLIGRFEILPVRHWSYGECRDAFGLPLEEYIYFGGYPGSIFLIKDQQRWARYIIDSIIETSLSRDVLLLSRIHRPTLLRRIFEFACHCSGNIFSFQQIIGQLQDSGNSHTVAQYLRLLSEAGLVAGLEKISAHLYSRASSPKLQVFTTAFISAPSIYSFETAQENRKFWNSLVQSTVAAHILNSTYGTPLNIFYWKEGKSEVDFIIQKGNDLLVLELESSLAKNNSGLKAFSREFNPRKSLLIGDSGFSLEEFLLTPINSLF
jgi:hypothetical protein